MFDILIMTYNLIYIPTRSCKTNYQTRKVKYVFNAITIEKKIQF